ncbi:MAG: rhomboid family intramembrane serine protease [Chitinophagaceae bacterium]|nr:rhomboid family intramembrane serine protease [Chitinophagaceae bacterium]
MAFYNSGNRIQRDTPIVFNLLIINALVFAAQNFITNVDVTNWGSLHYYKSTDFKPHQLITSVFLHGDIGHIIFNMFALYMFGSILERVWGSKRFLIFYLVCGIGASIFTQFTTPFSAEQFAKSSEAAQFGGYSIDLVNAYKEQYAALGASGAIMGVMAAFAWLFPNTELYVMFIPIPVKAKYVIPVFVLIDLFGGIYKIKGDNIGHFAHLGGAIIGFLLVLFWNKTNKKTFY